MAILESSGAAGGQGELQCAAMRDWAIVVAADALPAEHYAAEELQGFLRQATGLDLRLQSGQAEAPGQVRIGAAAPAAGNLGEEGFSVRVEQDHIAISGGRPRGVLYGVYQLLEDALGLRFLTHDHTHVPDAAAAAIPCGSWTYVPPFSYRFSAYRENSEYPEGAVRRRVNTVADDERLGGKTGQWLINHSVHTLVPFGEYGQEHPEYYALFEGERDTCTHGAGPQLCVTNPEVVEVAAAAAIRVLDEDPTRQNISVSQADTRRYCSCAACEAVNQREESAMGAQLEFVNAVAERIEKVHPAVKVGTLAYQYTRKAPRTLRPRANVQIQLCSIECCTMHPIDDPDCEKNREFCRDMAAWGAICDDIWIWNYNTNFRAYDLPLPNLRSIGPNVRYFRENNAKGAFMQANHNGLTGELCDLRNYILSQTLWNPELDSEQLCEEFVRLHYREAAAPLLEYVDMLHDNAEARGLHPRCFCSAEEVGLDPEVARKTMAYFDRALDLAASDEIRARVEKASICAHKAMVEAGGIVDGDERTALVEGYITLCERYGLTHSAEQKPAAQYFGELRADGAAHN